LPFSKLQAYASRGQASEDLFVNRSDAQLLSLPIGEDMAMAEADEVARAIRDFSDDQGTGRGSCVLDTETYASLRDDAKPRGRTMHEILSSLP
jgi:hypothetical protein